MRSGNLKHKIDFLSATEVKNAFGEVENTFTIFKSAYSEILPLSAKEYLASKQKKAEVTHKIELRFLSGILPTMQIVYGSRKFEIESIINVRELNKTLHIMATEIING
ncbi:MAG: phage head closure protein [Sulfurimonas sp.]|nr:phage head closure protein [Sulfurimonas sp.]